jgi:predicted nucleic acid-binding protein
MAYKAFLDTNIIIDFIQPIRPEHLAAKQLFYHLADDHFFAFYSESVVTNLAYILRKDFQPKTLITIIESLNNQIRLLPSSNTIIKTALLKNPKDIEDAILYETAIENDLDYFITTNKKDFKAVRQNSLKIISSKEFLALLNESIKN